MAKNKKYTCKICGRKIDESVAISHIRAEEYLMQLIQKDHPEWKKEDDTCYTCVEYYKKLVNDAEI